MDQYGHYANRDNINRAHKHVQSYIDSYQLKQSIRVNGRVISAGTYIQAAAARRAGIDKMPDVCSPCDVLGHPIGAALIADEMPKSISVRDQSIKEDGTRQFNKIMRFNMPTDEHIRLASKGDTFVLPDPILDIVLPTESAPAGAAPVVEMNVEVGPRMNQIPAAPAAPQAAPPAAADAPVSLSSEEIAAPVTEAPKRRGRKAVSAPEAVDAPPAPVEAPVDSPVAEEPSFI